MLIKNDIIKFRLCGCDDRDWSPPALVIDIQEYENFLTVLCERKLSFISRLENYEVEIVSRAIQKKHREVIMENKELCPNCDMQLEDPEVCNYCDWTRNELTESLEGQSSAQKDHEER